VQQFIVRWRRPRRALPQPEHNQYTPTIFPGDFPTWWSVPTHYINFEIKLQTIPELNRYQNFAPIPAWEVHFEKTKDLTNRRIKVQPQLDEYATSLSVFAPIPAWALHFEKTKDLTKRRLLTQPILDKYTPTIFDGDYPTWLAKESFRTKFIRHHLRIQEINTYPAILLSIAPLPSTILERSIRVDSDNATRRKSTSAMMLRMVLGSPTFEAAIGVGFSTSMTNDGLGKIGLMFNDGIGKTGTMSNDGIGLSSTMANDGIGKVGLITKDGIGETGDI